MMDHKAIILSVKTHFAHLIMSGKKVLEVRMKRLPSVDRIYIYASGEEKKVIGHCSFFGPVTVPYPWILRGACLSDEEYVHYCKGRSPFVYRLRDVVRYGSPLDLSNFGKIHSPQSYVYTDFIPSSVLVGES